jgi:hypothetical protein
MDSKLAYSIFCQKKNKYEVFHLEEIKRKPLKKKICKKILHLPTTLDLQQYRSCPCCAVKVINKHKC